MNLIKYLPVLFLLFSLNGKSQEITGELNKEVKKVEKISYVFDYPQNTKTAVPLIVFLHGSGERGTDIQMVKNHSPFTYKNLIKEPVAILAPQCSENVWWDTEAVYYLIKEIQQKYKIDASRIYLTGLSMGGWGTWKLTYEHPEIFAAVAPVCGVTDHSMIYNAEKYKDQNIHIYHGAFDDVVNPAQAIELYQAIKKLNPKTEITIFPDDNHNSWDSTYSDPKFYEWMLAQRKITE